jgi:DNA-binding response OmpR family regulator
MEPAWRILLVDDDAYIRLLLSSALPDAELLEAWRASDALEMALSERPDAIIVDRRLPDADGLELVRLLRADPALTFTPILFLTAAHEERDRLDVLEAGADEYLSKTDELADLADVERRIARLVAMAPEDRPSRRARLAGLVAAGAEGDPEPLPPSALPDSATKRKWFRR